MTGVLNSILLRDTSLTVGIAPSWGGALTRLDVRRGAELIPILRPAREHPGAGPRALGASSFPMLPYCGRLRAGSFEFEDRRYQFPLNAAPERHSSHGDGWSRSWELTQLDRRSATMSLALDPAAPMPYAATQHIEVQGLRVRLTLSVTNGAADRLPIGVGLHPYFAQRSLATLRAELPRRWRWDQECMPLNDEANPHSTDFAAGRPVEGLAVAAEYAQWNGRACVAWPSLGVEVALTSEPPLQHAVLWVPAGEDFFCFEPQSHACNALHPQAGHPAAEDFMLLEPRGVFEQRFDFLVEAD